MNKKRQVPQIKAKIMSYTIQRGNMNNQLIHKILSHPFIAYTKYHLKYI